MRWNRKKVILSFIFGWLCVGSVLFAWQISAAYDLYVIYGYLFPAIIALSLEYRYIWITLLPGGVVFLPFLLTPKYGYANLAASFFLVLWFAVVSWMKQKQRENIFPFYMVYIGMLLSGIFYFCINEVLVSFLASFNRQFWTFFYAFGMIPDNVILSGQTMILEEMVACVGIADAMLAQRWILDGRKKWKKEQKKYGMIFLSTVGITFLAVMFQVGERTSTEPVGIMMDTFKMTIGSVQIAFLKIDVIFLAAGVLIHFLEYRDHVKKVFERTRALEDGYKELERNSHLISHEFKAPIHAIQAQVEILEEDYKEQFPKEVQEAMEEILHYCKKSTDLISSVTKYSKENERTMQIKKIDMEELVTHVCSDLQIIYKKQKIEVQIAHLPKVEGDHFLLRQAVYNIFSNSVKFSSHRQKTRINISYFEEEKDVIYYFYDNGIGFDMKYEQKVFEMFGRLHSDREYEGSGIGLNSVRKIAQMHGGEVKIYAEKDRGCVVFLKLPREIS